VFKKSIVLPAFFPSSMENAQHFLNAIKTLKNYDICSIEFYYKGNDRKTIKEYLISHDIKSIYLGAMAAKQKNLNLSSQNKELREESVQEMKKCIDDAYFYGSYSILINSGRSPDNGEDEIVYEYLKKSLEELLKYIDVSAKDYKLNLTLEPGDTRVDSFSLIGNTDLAIKLVWEIREKYKNFGLTMDTSHLRQLDEKPLDSIKKAFPYCNHIHLANCIIKDKTSNLYGDKHPEFGIEGGEISIEELRNILKTIKKIYEGSELMVGLEIICRKENNKEEIDYFENMMKNLSWFYK
jgi:sugar phosphate isomerase/epimerase